MIKLACVDLERNVLTHFIIPLLNYAYIKVIPRDKMKNIMYGYSNERAGLIHVQFVWIKSLSALDRRSIEADDRK